MENSCDVNVIYNYSFNKEMKKISLYLKEIKKETFIEFFSIKTTFLTVIKRKIGDIGDSIIIAINKTKEDVLKQEEKTGELLSEKIIDLKLNSFLSKELKSLPYSFDLVDEFRTLILKKVNLIDLYLNELQLIEFRENLFSFSEKFALDLWYKFTKNLPNSKPAPRFKPSEQIFWEEKIHSLRDSGNYFADVDDEDIYVAIEYLTYLTVRNKKVKFATFDNNLFKSLNFLSVNENISGCIPLNLWHK